MCGRYVSTRSPKELAPLFRVTEVRPSETLAPSWNVAPTDEVWAVLERVPRGAQTVTRQLRPLRWGLVPSWAKDPGIGSRLINARMETAQQKPAFRRAFANRRCLLPADGFYEWQSLPATGDRRSRKQPYFIHPADGRVMALAGLYEFWRDPGVPDKDDPAAWWTTCTIITTEATDAAGRIHPRMPLAVSEADYDAWLDPAQQDTDRLRTLLITPADGHLDARPVSTAVNNVRNDGPQLLDAVPAP
ncbi:SOS response-associated peptidase [Streptomyces sp. GC420]|uniref:SOS response-associated peptidase n=1 Tax=Streptomyces sp. GC420 TaxID=2697568 RepID=UPI0014152158|nr:SOS response-associated peptidase [Streptomyces sp. GC420]NBM16710.1 SOS response-associated peptidase [Streptomyces sp. GC420]